MAVTCRPCHHVSDVLSLPTCPLAYFSWQHGCRHVVPANMSVGMFSLTTWLSACYSCQHVVPLPTCLSACWPCLMFVGCVALFYQPRWGWCSVLVLLLSRLYLSLSVVVTVSDTLSVVLACRSTYPTHWMKPVFSSLRTFSFEIFQEETWSYRYLT